jgi:hypothetical protein
MPCSQRKNHSPPSRHTVASRNSETAFTAETPTPWRPAETL